MKFKLVLLGLLAVAAGIIPILHTMGIMTSPFPIEGIVYSLIVIGIGAIDLLYTLVAHVELIGTGQHLVTAFLAIVLIVLGIFPFITASLPASVPTSGVAYFGIITAVGVVETIYGFSLFRYG